MGLDEKPTNTASQTSKFAVLISAITLLVFFGGLLHVELILNTRVRHLEAQIQSMQPSKVPFSDSETVNLESKTKPSNKEQHQQNENNYGKPVKKAETPTEDECDYGPDCVQQLENNQNFFHANRMRRDIAMFMLFSNQTLEHLKKELSTTIYQRLKNVILTQKKLPKDPKSKLSVNRIRQALRKIISWKFDGLPGHDGPTGPKGEMGYQGRKGSKGSTGFPGLRGTNEYKLGDTGHTGSKGDVGLQGPKGDKGQKGDLGNGDLKGYPGLPGPRGFRGEEGDTGTTGPQGVPGLPGLQGKKGKEGFPGEQGLFASCKRCE